MARGAIQGYVQDKNGNALSGVSVFVYDAGTTDLVVLYDAATGGVPVTNPLTTTELGYFVAWAEIGTYDVNAANGITELQGVAVFDADSLEDVAANVILAQDAATAASTSAGQAANSATAALNSETAAAASAVNAATSETNAATSETNAANSATASAGSATASANSATDSANSATASASSATDSANSAAAASASATDAGTSASNAATSETNAATSASNAATSESNAATSETNAATSESNASTSEANALVSENRAHDWAEKPYNVEVDPVGFPGEFSAHSWATESANIAATIAVKDAEILVDDIAALKALAVAALLDGTRAYVAFHTNAADGGGGLFIYDSGNSDADDNGVTIAPTAGSGRWVRRIYDNWVHTSWFGTIGGAAQTANVQAAIDFCDTNAYDLWIDYKGVAIQLDSALVLKMSNRKIFSDGARFQPPAAALASSYASVQYRGDQGLYSTYTIQDDFNLPTSNDRFCMIDISQSVGVQIHGALILSNNVTNDLEVLGNTAVTAITSVYIEDIEILGNGNYGIGSLRAPGLTIGRLTISGIANPWPLEPNGADNAVIHHIRSRSTAGTIRLNNILMTIHDIFDNATSTTPMMIARGSSVDVGLCYGESSTREAVMVIEDECNITVEQARNSGSALGDYSSGSMFIHEGAEGTTRIKYDQRSFVPASGLDNILQVKAPRNYNARITGSGGAQPVPSRDIEISLAVDGLADKPVAWYNYTALTDYPDTTDSIKVNSGGKVYNHTLNAGSIYAVSEPQEPFEEAQAPDGTGNGAFKGYYGEGVYQAAFTPSPVVNTVYFNTHNGTVGGAPVVRTQYKLVNTSVLPATYQVVVPAPNPSDYGRTISVYLGADTAPLSGGVRLLAWDDAVGSGGSSASRLVFLSGLGNEDIAVGDNQPRVFQCIEYAANTLTEYAWVQIA